MEFLAGKSDRIRDAVAQLGRRVGQPGFTIVGCWPDDPEVIGIARPGEEEPCVCILTTGKDAGRFDVEYGGTVYRDCLIQGLCCVVREELGRRA